MSKTILLTVNSNTTIFESHVNNPYKVDRLELTNNNINEIILFFAETGNIKVLKILVSHGYDIHIRNQASLIIAANTKNIELINFLVDNGANVKNAIKYCTTTKSKKFLKVYVHTYKGEINEQTETDCGFCLTKMCSKKQKMKTLTKSFHFLFFFLLIKD